jgi:hypothetical protein
MIEFDVDDTSNDDADANDVAETDNKVESNPGIIDRADDDNVVVLVVVAAVLRPNNDDCVIPVVGTVVVD